MKSKLLSGSLVLAWLLASVAPAARAHHGWGGQYDTTKEIELTGVIKSVQWTNPHVTFKMLVDGGKSTEKLWTIESNSVSALVRMGIEKTTVAIGSTVKVSGFGPVAGANFGLFMNHMLLPDGKEIVFLRGAAPRWSDEIIGNDDRLHGKVVENDINKRPATVFSVWTVVYNDNNSHGMHVITPAPAAAAATPAASGMAAGTTAAMTPVVGADGAVIVCHDTPAISEMGSPYPMELIDQIARNKTVVMKVEKDDTVRVVHITAAPHKAVGAPSLAGYSTGVVDANKKKLTVTTSNVLGGPEVVYTETFELSDDRNRLNYTVKSTKSPEVRGRYWQYQPGAKVMPYGCTNAK